MSCCGPFEGIEDLFPKEIQEQKKRNQILTSAFLKYTNAVDFVKAVLGPIDGKIAHVHDIRIIREEGYVGVDELNIGSMGVHLSLKSRTTLELDAVYYEPFINDNRIPRPTNELYLSLSFEEARVSDIEFIIAMKDNGGIRHAPFNDVYSMELEAMIDETTNFLLNAFNQNINE